MEAKLRHLLVHEAARRYARMQAIDCSDAERSECDAWRKQSPEHDEAFRQAERVAQCVSEGLLADARLRALAAAALKQPAAAEDKFSKHWRVAAALVLSATLTVFAAVHLFKQAPVEVSARYENTSNEQRLIVLNDGTTVHLDVGGSFTAQIDASSRHIELLTGRAYFEVRHDATRPFAVDAGNVRTLDVGTRFQVALAPEAVSVTLAEGAVAVSQRAGEDAWKETLVPGEQLNFSATTGMPQKQRVDATVLTSWSRGRLVFKDTPLAEALEEVNRYAETKVRIGDRSLAAIPIGGDFIAGGDSEHVVDALAAILPLRVVHVGNHEIILFHSYESENP